VTSKRKRESNRANSGKSTGPKSLEGKSVAARNSLKHGIWAKELVIPESLQDEYMDLVAELEIELEPTGALQRYYFDEIVICMWRLKILVRLENQQFKSPDHATPQGEIVVPTPIRSEREMHSRHDESLGFSRPKARELAEQVRVLRALSAKVRGTFTLLTKEERKDLDNLFDSEFVKRLDTWALSGSEVLATLLEKAAKTEKNQIPFTPGLSQRAFNEPHTIGVEVKKTVLLQMIESRIEKIEARLLEIEVNEIRPDMLGVRLDLQLRYKAALKRDLQKALDAFFRLKRAGNDPLFPSPGVKQEDP
jgi:hypothetical protein